MNNPHKHWASQCVLDLLRYGLFRRVLFSGDKIEKIGVVLSKGSTEKNSIKPQVYWD
jgi:hypothetical protein